MALVQYREAINLNDATNPHRERIFINGSTTRTPTSRGGYESSLTESVTIGTSVETHMTFRSSKYKANVARFCVGIFFGIFILLEIALLCFLLNAPSCAIDREYSYCALFNLCCTISLMVAIFSKTQKNRKCDMLSKGAFIFSTFGFTAIATWSIVLLMDDQFRVKMDSDDCGLLTDCFISVLVMVYIVVFSLLCCGLWKVLLRHYDTFCYSYNMYA